MFPGHSRKLDREGPDLKGLTLRFFLKYFLFLDSLFISMELNILCICLLKIKLAMNSNMVNVYPLLCVKFLEGTNCISAMLLFFCNNQESALLIIDTLTFVNSSFGWNYLENLVSSLH